MLATRIKTALLLLPPVLIILWFGGLVLQWLAIIIYLIINAEYFRFATKLPERNIAQLSIASLLLPLGYLLFGWGGFALGVVMLIFFHCLFHIFLIEKSSHQPQFAEVVPASFLGVCYTGVLGSMLVIITDVPQSNVLLCWLFGVVACSDTFAYFGGRLFGKRKLAPRVSPGKTWFGAFTGLAGAVAGGYLIAMAFDVHHQTVLVLGFALIAGVVAQLGDLVESMVKRVYSVKDSGALLPGHGGLLDRVDALLFAVPILFFAEFLIGAGV